MTSNSTDLWIGTYTRKEGHVDGKAAGIYHWRVTDSLVQELSTTSGIPNPSFVRLSPDGQFLYAVSETGPDIDSTGYVYAYAIDGDSLRLLNRQASHNFAPCNVSVHPAGKWLYLTNYVGGTIARYPIAQNGELAPAETVLVLEGSGPHDRQDSSHPHSATVSPDGRWVMVADLGTDLIHTLTTADTEWKSQAEVQLPPGAGPRHLAFHPTAPYAFSINELNSTITAFHYQLENGALHIIDHYSSLPTDFEGFNLTADIHISPDGRWLYASNRGHNSIVAYAIDEKTGQLTYLQHADSGGDFPRNFAIHPDGQSLWVANQNTDNIRVFALDDQTGRLTTKQEMTVLTPVCLQFAQ